MDFHYHIETHFTAASIDEDTDLDVVDGCAPADEFDQFVKERNAWLCTSDILKIPGRFEECVFQVHKSCYSSCWKGYKTPEGSEVVSPGRKA